LRILASLHETSLKSLVPKIQQARRDCKKNGV